MNKPQSSPVTVQARQQLAWEIEAVIRRRLFEDRIEGYTKPMSEEIAALFPGVAQTSVDASYWKEQHKIAVQKHIECCGPCRNCGAPISDAFCGMCRDMGCSEPSTSRGVGDWPPPFEMMKLQAQSPDGGDWTDIFPAQLQAMVRSGCAVRAIEPTTVTSKDQGDK